MNEVVSISQGMFPFLIIIFSIILHEVGHGYAAFILGDKTAHRAGRLTLNPLPHLDTFGSVIVPFIAFFTAGTFFGWAKPVPYNPYNIRTPLGQAFVASAGVLTNLLLAILSGIVFKVLFMQELLSVTFGQALFTIISVNVSLAFFNLIPIPPFDGMSILSAFFPRLSIRSSVMYNPLYMIAAIIAASVLYGMFIPYVFAGVSAILL